jgi:hypothetical protein
VEALDLAVEIPPGEQRARALIGVAATLPE